MTWEANECRRSCALSRGLPSGLSSARRSPPIRRARHRRRVLSDHPFSSASPVALAQCVSVPLEVLSAGGGDVEPAPATFPPLVDPGAPFDLPRAVLALVRVFGGVDVRDNDADTSEKDVERALLRAEVVVAKDRSLRLPVHRLRCPQIRSDDGQAGVLDHAVEK